MKEKINYSAAVLIILGFMVSFARAMAPVADPDPHRFDDTIQAFMEWDQKNALPEHPVLFVGSSSIRMWLTHECFPGLPVINRGFGGSHISDVLFFLNDVTLKYKPAVVVFYAGDNDVNSGKSPEQVVADYKKFVSRVHSELPQTQIIYIPIKPSISRWEKWPVMKTVNDSIRLFSNEQPYLFYADTATPMLGTDGKPLPGWFLKDNLHLNLKGYELWTGILKPVLESVR